jgi:hypothetical protein
MSFATQESMDIRPKHAWLRQMRLALLPGPMTPLLDEVVQGLLHHARLQGHVVQATPDDDTDLILTTAAFGEVVNWRRAPVIYARQRYNLRRPPAVYTLVHATTEEFQSQMERFRVALSKDPADPRDFEFPGLAPGAHRVLLDQGRRGGAIMAVERLVQAQAKSIRVLLVIGDEQPQAAYHFDLVGAHPRTLAGDRAFFYNDIVLRMITTVCTSEVTEHEVVDEPVQNSVWRSLSTPGAMRKAGMELGKRDFFTEGVRIADLVHVPALEDVVAEQYSEGCFATWDPSLGALVTTVTGSARPVDKTNISDDELAVIIGVRPDQKGALVRPVEGKHNSPPSSEALELIDMDRTLPRISLGPEWGITAEVPVARSKLHGHRGIAAYDPEHVEFVPLSPQYYYYIVSCATGAQAEGIREAFSRSEALQNPSDPRQVAFAVLPGHGMVIAEKWVAGKMPFQVIWEYMDAGFLQVAARVPQGPMEYVSGPGEMMFLRVDEAIAGTG